jgi:AhpD family alkylhydroperoxidase
MKQRFDLTAAAPDGYKAMLGLHSYVEHSGLDLCLLELVRIRISQINGCAFCLSMHIPNAQKHGATQDQLNLVAVWREAPVFDERTRAALAWGEALTHLNSGVSDEAYGQVAAHFSTKEIADLSLAIAEINAWNRLMAGSCTPPMLAVK